MRLTHALCTYVLAVSCLAVSVASADIKVTQDTLGPDGQLIGGSISPKGGHIAILATKGSHYQIIMDGDKGPKIDSLIFNTSGAAFRVDSENWGDMPIPVIFSKDGAHWAYMAKQSDEFVVMLDGKEFGRGSIKPQNLVYNLNLTFSTNGQHIFWSDVDANGQNVFVADGKAGPAMRNLPTLVLSPDGEHYAYVYANPQGVSEWAFVDGRQVNYFGDNLQYTGRNVLISTASANNATILCINGKPSIKAASLNPMWISPDGKQIAIMITPTQGAQPFLTVDGKQIAGTEGVPISNLYFSPDGAHWAALCRTKTGANFMMIDGKKGDEYQSIAPQIASQNHMHWLYVAWPLFTTDDFSQYDPPLPGFTPDSSKFVYVANSGGRQFLVVNDDESNAFGGMLFPMLSTVGNHVGAIGTTPDNVQHLIVDDKDTASPVGRISQLTFSPQGGHFAYIQGQSVVLDGVVQPGLAMGDYVLSQDDKHIAYPSNINQRPTVVVDGKIVGDKLLMSPQHIFFSPDCKHIYWFTVSNIAYQERIDTKDSTMLYVDGKPATHYSGEATQFNTGTQNANSIHPEFSPDDEMTFYARTDGVVRRFHVTSDTDLDTILATAPAAK
jgi:hypothetical protein